MSDELREALNGLIEAAGIAAETAAAGEPDHVIQRADDAVDSARSRVEALCRPPDGWVLVPREPTEEMLAAVTTQRPRLTDEPAVWGFRREIWAAMLAAAPTPPAPAQREGLSEDQERAAFERVISEAPFQRGIQRYSATAAWPGSYHEIDVDLAWQVWQARARIGDSHDR